VLRLLTFLGVFLSTPVLASPKRLGSPTSHLDFHPISDLVDVSYGSDPTLIGGVAVEPGDYPGVFYTSQGNSRCTGTLIGPKVVASAAHCMKSGGSLKLTYKGKTYSGTCSHAPEYRGNSTADWALCHLTEALPDAVAESVLVDSTKVKVGDQIRLMGYGCIRNGGGGGNDGVLRTNMAKVTSVPKNSNYDTVTGPSSAALCYGDSGGPSFVEGTDGKRYQLAINSRGNIRDTSYLSTLWVAPAQTFYKKWAEEKGVKICGVHGEFEGCRNYVKDPAPPLPETCETVVKEKSLEVYGQCLTGRALPSRIECDKARYIMDECYVDRYP
jgi:hypothetical protein